MSAYDLIMSIFADEGLETDPKDMLALACKFIDESALDPGLFEEFLLREISIEE